MNRLIIIVFIALVSGCADYAFHSNLDKENFDNYFKPSHVIVYDKKQLLDLEYTILSAVEGSSCQESEIDIPANKRDARTKARINAADMNANGIIFHSCLNIEQDETCISNVICYGRALDVEIPENE